MEETLANQAEHNKAPETKATSEVQDAITKIEATESAIAEHTGATGQELTNNTDQFLVDHAEHAADLDASDKADIVETALVEGALESTGERPVATENPIITLEKDGYDQQVTDGVKKLHEEGATLPDGESAAEVVVATLEAQGMHQEQPTTPFNTESLKGRTESISEVVEHARQSGAKVAEIPVWGAESVPVNVGEVGVIATAGLNGCHTTILAGKNERGESVVAMTHFPPELGSQRYAQAVHEHKDTFEQQGVVLDTVFTFVDKTRFPKETEMLATEFPDANFHSMEYDSRNPDEKGQDYGKCVAVLDNSGEQAVLTVLTDRGDEQLAIGGNEAKTGVSDQLDTAIQYYVNGASKEDILEHTGLDPAALTEHIRGLPTEEADYLKEMRRKSLGEDETVGAQVPAETKNQENWRDSVDPKVLALATNPDSITDPVAKREALDKAGRISGGERIILQDNEGNPRWGEELSEPGQVFAFNGNIRGNYDSAPEDPEELRAQRLDIHLASGALRGNVTHVIVETEDGQQLMIRRINETNSANDQLFDVASTSRAGTDGERRSLDSSTLKDVVAVVSEPLVLGIDPQTGKHIKTKSPITKITTLDMRKDPVDPSHPRLSKPELRRDTIGEFGEAMRAARNHPADKVVMDEAKSVTVELPSDRVESANPYESLAPEQLAKVRDNIADSIVQGIRKYDLDEVARASANLAAIQREIETRSPEARPRHQRGEVAGDVTYVTEPDTNIVQKIVGELQKIDGASNIARAMYGGLETPQPNTSDVETRLQAIEMNSLLANISREIRDVTGSEFSESTNPYAAMKNEELTKTVDRLKQAIQEGTAKGQDTTDFRNRLAQVGQVIQSRQ